MQRFVVAVLGLFIGSVQAHDMTCKAVLQRMDLLPKTPHHQFVSMGATAETKAPLSESIATDTSIYVQEHGVWRNSGFTPAEMSKRETAARKKKIAHCAVVREEVLENANTTLYSVQTEADFGMTDSQLWVSTTTGLPLLERYSVDTGAEKRFYEVRFVYTDIAAPPGV